LPLFAGPSFALFPPSFQGVANWPFGISNQMGILGQPKFKLEGQNNTQWPKMAKMANPGNLDQE